MNFDLSNYLIVNHSPHKLYFDRESNFREIFNHRRRTRRFPYYKNILQFLDENIGVIIAFTRNENCKPFRKIENGFLINIESYLYFCRAARSNTSGRLKAFLGQNITIRDIDISDEDREQFVEDNITEGAIFNALPRLSLNEQKNLLIKLQGLVPQGSSDSAIKYDENQIIKILIEFSDNTEVQQATLTSLPYIQLETLRNNVEFLKNSLDKTETDIQNWLDEEDGKYRKHRSLIFGLEYVDPKREGEISRKNFDVLAEQDREHHVIIELKGPGEDVFDIKEIPNQNGGVSTEYNLSTKLARAIPQVLGYKKLYDGMTSEELEKLGISNKKMISKCIIVIGTRKSESNVWVENFEDLKKSLSGIELLTYTDLISKLENTIKNLEEVCSS